MKKVFTTGQVAKICKVAPRTVSKWFDSGRLRGYRIPGSQDRRIPREQLIKFLKEHGMPLGELEEEGWHKILIIGAESLFIDRVKELLPDELVESIRAGRRPRAVDLNDEISPRRLESDTERVGRRPGDGRAFRARTRRVRRRRCLLTTRCHEREQSDRRCSSPPVHPSTRPPAISASHSAESPL